MPNINVMSDSNFFNSEVFAKTEARAIAQEPPRVLAMLDYERDQIDRLEKVLETFKAKLAPVLSPESPTKNGEASGAERRPQSEMTSIIESRANQIKRIKDEFCELLDRIEL